MTLTCKGALGVTGAPRVGCGLSILLAWKMAALELWIQVPRGGAIVCILLCTTVLDTRIRFLGVPLN